MLKIKEDIMKMNEKDQLGEVLEVMAESLLLFLPVEEQLEIKKREAKVAKELAKGINVVIEEMLSDESIDKEIRDKYDEKFKNVAMGMLKESIGNLINGLASESNTK